MATKRAPSAIRQRRLLLRICVILALTPPLFILELRPDSVLKVYFSRDGLHLLSKHEGRADQYWEAATGRRISERRGRAALAPGEEFYISWPYFERSPKEPGVALVYGPRGPMRLDHGAEVVAVDLSQDRGTLASGTKAKTVHLWDVATSRELRRFRGHEGPVTAVALSADGRVLASASEDKTVRLWDITGTQATRVLSGHSRTVRWVAFSPDSRLLASGGADGTIRMWSVETGRELWRAGAYPTRIDTRPWMDKPMANFGQVVLLSLVTVAWFSAVLGGLYVLATVLAGGRVKAVQLSPDGVTLAVAGPSDLLLLETATGSEVWSRFVRETPRREIVFLELARFPGAPILADTRAYGVVFRSLESGRVLRRLRGHRLSAGLTGAVTPDGRLAAFAGLTGAVTPDGRLAAFGGVRTVRRRGVDQQLGAVKFVETESRHEHILDGHEKPVSALAFHPDGSLLASGSADKTIRLWDTAATTLRSRLAGHARTVTCLAFSPDGALLASGSDDSTVRLWDVAAGAERAKLQGHAGPVTSVAFSPDGRCVASCSVDTTVRLWEAATGKELRRMEGHTKQVNALAFSPDGAFLVSGGDDKIVRAWDTATGEPLWRLTAKRVGIYGYRFEKS